MRWRGVLGVVIVVLSLLTGVGPAQASNAVVGAITGYGGKCVDVPGGSTVNGTQVQLWTCNETMAQQWTLTGDGTIRALGMCLDVFYAGTTNGTPVVLANCNGSVAQQWVASSSSGLRNPHANACLDATGISSADGTPLQIWSCTGTANQQWVQPVAKTYVVPLTSDCVDVRDQPLRHVDRAQDADRTPHRHHPAQLAVVPGPLCGNVPM